jgi:cytochrome P450
MSNEVIIFVLVAVGLFFVLKPRGQAKEENKRKKSDSEEEKTQVESSSLYEHYQNQDVYFVEKDTSYVKQMKSELESNNPHFNKLRKLAASDAKGKDFFGIQIENKTWLFPVSQKHLKNLYSMTNLDGEMASKPFNQAVGYAPLGMPFMETNGHWKELRKNLAAIFHSDWMDQYMENFNVSMKELIEMWKKNNNVERNIKHDICNMAYNSAVLSLTGNKLDVDVPYVGEKGTSDIHIRDANTKTLNDFAHHAATKEYAEDEKYRFKSNSSKVNRLNQNMDTLGGALTGLVTGRVGEITNGATPKKTIVDAAIGLVTAGVVKSVDEAVQHGWAILNGAHNNCGNALSAALYFLLKNPECYEKLRKEFQEELFNGKDDLDESNLDSIITRENLKELNYLSYVVKETLRLSSPIYGKTMEAQKDVKLEDGFNVKKGTIIYPNNGVIGVSENIWKDPLKFIPERFDPESPYFKLPDGKSKREPITWLAFGSGPRACMGDNYSMYFVKVGLAYFMHLMEFNIKEEDTEGQFFYWLVDKNFTAEVKYTKA